MEYYASLSSLLLFPFQIHILFLQAPARAEYIRKGGIFIMEMNIYDQLALLYVQKSNTLGLEPADFYDMYCKARDEICERAKKKKCKVNS